MAAEALQVAKSIGHQYARALALTRLAQQLAIPMLKHALEVAEAIEDKPCRAAALANIASSLSGDARRAVFDQALKTARAVEWKPERAETLANIASFLSGGLRRAAFDEALETARAVESDARRAEDLASTAWFLSDGQRETVLDESLATARAIVDQSLRVEVLTNIASLLSDHGRELVLEEALQTARAIADRFQRARALRKIASLLPNERRQTVLEEVRRATGAMLSEPETPYQFEEPVSGRIAFAVPEGMKVGQTERIKIRLGHSIVADLIQGLVDPTIEEIEIANLMQVTLYGQDFTIISLNSEKQLVREERVSHWDFKVTPMRSGIRNLHLLVTMKFGDREDPYDVPSLDRPVTVKVAPAYTTVKVLEDNWRRLSALVILPLIGWFATTSDLKSRVRPYFDEFFDWFFHYSWTSFVVESDLAWAL